jgi:hypothetical protein
MAALDDQTFRENQAWIDERQRMVFDSDGASPEMMNDWTSKIQEILCFYAYAYRSFFAYRGGCACWKTFRTSQTEEVGRPELGPIPTFESWSGADVCVQDH